MTATPPRHTHRSLPFVSTEDEDELDPYFREILKELDRRRASDQSSNARSFAAGAVAACFAALLLFKFPDVQGQYKSVVSTVHQAQHMISSLSVAVNTVVSVIAALSIRRSRQSRQDSIEQHARHLEVCSFQVIELIGNEAPFNIKVGGLMQKPVSQLFADGGRGAKTFPDLVLQCADLCDRDRIIVPLPPDNIKPASYYRGRRSSNVMESLRYLLMEKIQLPGLGDRLSNSEAMSEVSYLFCLVNFKDDNDVHKLRVYLIKESSVALIKRICPEGSFNEVSNLLSPTSIVRSSRVRAVRALAQMAEVYEPLPIDLVLDSTSTENLALHTEPLHPGMGRLWLTQSKL